MNSHLRFYNMKRFYITLWVLSICLCINAQIKFHSQKELQEHCDEIQDKLDFIEDILDTIYNAQIKKLKELNVTDYDIDTLKQSNQHVFDGIKDILRLIPKVYEKDTTNSIALEQFYALAGTYNEYCQAVAISKEGITISDNFQKVIENANTKIADIKKELGAKETIEQSPEEESNNNRNTLDRIKEIPLEYWLILAFNAILMILGIILIIKMHQRLDRHSHAIKEFNDFKKNVDNHGNCGITKSASKNSFTNHSTIGQHDLDKLRTDLLGEINKIKDEIARLKPSTTHLIKKTNTNHAEQTKNSDSSNEQDKPKTLKGMYAQLQENGSFKTYDSDRTNAFYIISLNNTSNTVGEFSLKDLSPEIAKAAIDDRNSLLVAACDIIETSANPKKIKVKSFGTAEKRGNEWYVKDKAKISLID